MQLIAEIFIIWCFEPAIECNSKNVRLSVESYVIWKILMVNLMGISIQFSKTYVETYVLICHVISSLDMIQDKHLYNH